MRVADFDKVIHEIERILERSPDLEAGDKVKVRAVLRVFRQLQVAYHGEEDQDDDPTPDAA